MLDLRYQGNLGAKIELQAQATFTMDNLTIIDGSTPLTFSVTGTTLTNIVVTGNVGVATFPSTLTSGHFQNAVWVISGSTTSALNQVVSVSATAAATTITFPTVGVSNGTYSNGALTMTYGAPFVHSTNTTLKIRDNSFIGNGAPGQDAIVLGGNNASYPDPPDQTSPFNGYGTVIESNSFAYLNRGLYARANANDVTFERNSFVRHSVGLVAVECDGSQSAASGGYTYGVRVNNNLFEVDSYNPVIKLTKCQTGTYIANSFYDGSAVAYSLNGASYDNLFVLSFLFGSSSIVDDDSGVTLGTSTILGGTQRTGFRGYGLVSSEIGRGMNVSGHGDLTKLTSGYPGQFTISALTNAKMRLSLGALSSGDFFVDAYLISTGAQVLQLNPSGGAVSFGGSAIAKVGAASALPTCNSGAEGSTRGVTDSNTSTWGATVAGGSTNHVLAYCNGTNWTVYGK